MNTRFLRIASILLFVCLPAAQAGEIVFNTDFPDPSVIRAADGWYYAYATQGDPGAPFAGEFHNIQLARSLDLKNWIRLPDALPVKPSWAATTQNFWAPHIHFHGGLYYLYFSAQHGQKRFGPANLGPRGRYQKGSMCIGVALARTPQGPFRDSGRPLQCANGFEAIDPMLFEHPQSGRPILVWGSGFGPIWAQELAEDRLQFKPGSRPVALLRPFPGPYTGLLEGAWMVYEHGYYFLFVSGDSCCEPPHYAVMVARSRSPAGPFELRNEPLIEADSRTLAPGHNSLIRDGLGRGWTLYHGIDRAAAPKGRVMFRSRLDFTGGWPRLLK
jgi:arabinan endo-1,5-alpha-L-arabinosidase